MTTKATDTETTYYATRNFKDAGTERSFEAHKEIKDVDADTMRNYVAAGAASTEKPKPPEKAAAGKQTGETPVA